MARIFSRMCDWFRCDKSDRRPRVLRRVLPMSFATSRPLNGTEMAKLHMVAYH